LRDRSCHVAAARSAVLTEGSLVIPCSKALACAGVQVLAMRPSSHGDAREPAPVHPHLLRHARVRQLVRSTKSLPLAQKQARWSRLQMAYLTIGDDEARELMRGVTD